MKMIKLIQQLNDNFKYDCLKTIYACSCSCKQESNCNKCCYGQNCLLHKDGRGFVNLNNLVFDFDMISVRFNKGTKFHSVDSLIVHGEKFASLIEFTDGEPRNKSNLVKKSIDTIETLKMIDEDFETTDCDFYFVYNTNKFRKDKFDDYKNNYYNSIDYDLFTALIDLNAEDYVLNKYFKLNKIKVRFKSVFAYNEKKFFNEVNCNIDKWNVY